MIENILALAIEIAEIPSDKVVEWDATAGFKPFHEFFVKDAVKHPAKANLHMIRWIIEKYTKEGDTICDPMAGTGSTGIMASLLGRNAILVEYEQKFVDMIKQNINQLNNTGKMLGMATVVKGDARSLSDVLSNKVEHVIFSPPYSEGLGHKCSPEKRFTSQGVDRLGALGYSQDKSNIGNLPYGKVDTIVTSPPYAEATSGGGIAIKGHFQDAHLAERVYSDKTHNLSAGNLGNLKYGQVDSIVTSPPYSEAISKRGGNSSKYQREKLQHIVELNKQMRQYSDDKNNIGSLNHTTYLEAMLQVYQQCFGVLKPNGLMVLITKNFIRKKQVVRLDLDTIALCERAGFALIDRWYRKLTNFSFWVTNYYRKYGLRVEYEDILVFRKSEGEGKVDVVISSPPYAETQIDVTNREEIQRSAKDSFVKNGYFDFMGKRWTLEEWKKVNLGRMDGRGVRHGNTETYGKNPNNIGNLPYGKVTNITEITKGNCGWRGNCAYRNTEGNCTFTKECKDKK